VIVIGVAADLGLIGGSGRGLGKRE
jgi:hypothetical protein